MTKQEKSWFGVKGLFRHVNPDHPAMRARYEESVIVVRAQSQEDAHEQALELFQKYANEELGIIFTEHHEVCELFDPVRAGREVYWFMRVSSLSPEKYIEKYWDDGKPRSCDDKGWTHVWHNLDGKNSACLNCREVRRGQLWKKRKART